MSFSALTVEDFAAWLTLHTHIAYGVLFFGAYLETFILTCFLIPGGIFFIAGSALAGAHVLSLPFVLGTVYLGAILGDHSSYWLGRMFGASLFKDKNKILNRTNYEKGERFFAKYGSSAIFFSRLLGPLSWITPFLAGTYRVRYRVFSIYNAAGVFVGVGRYLVVGYFFGTHYSLALWFIERYFVFGLLILALILASHWYLTKQIADKA